MILTLTIVSILAITLVVWLARKFLPFTICPICAGVFLTWVGLLSLYFLGYQIDPVLPGMLMGGSVVGIAYQFEKRLGSMSSGAFLLWKVFFMSTGFVAVYSILKQWWIVSALALAALLLVSLLFIYIRGTSTRERASGEMEKKLENCC